MPPAQDFKQWTTTLFFKSRPATLKRDGFHKAAHGWMCKHPAQSQVLSEK